MKKIYTLLTLFVASLFGIAAQAETRTVTFHVDDATHLQPVQRYSSDVTLTFDENNDLQVTFGEDYELRKLVFNAADDYKISSILKADGTEFSSSWVLYPNPNTNPQSEVEFTGYDTSDGFYVEEGQVINIETTKVESKVFTFKGNPDHIKYAYVSGKYVYMDESGELSYDVTDVYTFYLYLNDDCVLNTVTDEEGNEVNYTYSSYNNYISIRPGDFEGSTTFIVSSTSKDDLRTASLNVSIVNGTASDVDFYRGGKTMTIEGTEFVVKFDPENEADFKVGRNPWSKKLFKVELDGEDIPYSNYYHSFNPKDGSNLVITVDAPVKPIPVKFVFTNEGTEGVLSRLSCDGKTYTAEECTTAGFTLNYGSIFYIELNEDDYEVESILYNGEDGYRGEILTEDEYVVTITATKRPMKQVTFKCEAWEHIALEDDWGKKITLTGAETVYEKVALPEYFGISTKDGYVLNSVTDEATGTDLLVEGYYGNMQIRNFSDGMTIVIDANEFVRDQEMVIYLEDAEWTSTDIYLASYTDQEKKITLEPGYNHVMFGTGDFNDDSWAIDPDDYAMYLNDEPVEIDLKYGRYPYPVGLDKIKAGDVLKIYSEEKDTHTVTYQIAEDVNAEVYHDHVVAVESPATHAVLPGTEIHIKPAMAMARAAATGLSVKVNGQTIEPGADGVFTVTADGDKEIKIDNDPSTSIAEIGAEDASKAYDLMGRRVNTNHRGLTIINGKKVMK
ncbi:MAG: hypothetical protein K2K82_07270 [Muribaculaceae bacterium]|nr:hypothetical protein [Muribaculaceae bacterium]